MWTKQAVDVVFSQNEIYGHRSSDSSYGACTGFQYAPQFVWFLFNRLHHCDVGIGVSSDSGLGNGTDSFFVGNVIYAIHSPYFEPSNAWSGGAFMLAGGVNRYLANNTIADVDAGISVPGDGSITIADNIIVTPGNHVFLEDSSIQRTFRANLTETAARVRIGTSSSTPTGFSAGDPRFVSPTDFRLQVGSPAIDKGTLESVYASYKSRYGVDIAVDHTGGARPSGTAWDIGAYEYGSVGTSAPPFGSFDIPASGATGVTGAVALSGWALDDSGVANLKIYRDPESGEATQPNGKVYIGDATFIPGARPDVAAAYPSYPNATRAGWGYMLLTNFLPGSGNGSYTVYAYATDTAGLTALLGSKTFSCANATATKPFGTLDTPGQGATASGVAFMVWGWALTPQPGLIPLDGSTIYVFVDGVPKGNATYNNYRADVANAFPGYANSGGAIGYFVLDTTRLANGLHTIAWSVTDNLGRSDGIGSRHFWVQN
jgi:hypothetical protein